MDSTSALTQKLFQAGRYAEVVALYEKAGINLFTLPPEHRTDAALCLHHCGKLARSEDLARFDDRPSNPPSIRSRSQVVIGLTRRLAGELDAAMRHFQAATALARDGQDWKQAAWSSLHLFRTMADAVDPQALSGRLSEVRTLVTRAGDPHAAAYLHDSIARMEAFGGRLEQARRHVRITGALIDQYPHAWLQQVHHMGGFALNFLECRYQEALSQIELARQLIDIVGSSNEAIITCNQAHALLMVGHFDAAIHRFREIVASTSPLYVLGSLDGLARAYLATGRLAECEESMDRFQRLAAKHSTMASAYSVTWSCVTRVKLLLRSGRFADALKAAESNLATAEKLGDQPLINILGSLKAEALGNLGLHAAAAESLLAVRLDRTHDKAIYYRSAGLLCRPASASVGNALRQRAEAIWREQNDRCSVSEFGESPITEGEDSRPSGAVVANSIAAAFDVTDNPRLLAHELVTAVRALGPSIAVDVVETRASSHRSPRLKNCVELGERGGQTVSLVFKTPADPLKATLLNDIVRIARVARELRAAREQERNRAALWPADPVEEQAGALFIAEEMQTLLATARRVAPTNVPILITGETGTGKEILARTLHAYSTRAKGHFVPFNCTSTPREMIDAQLFGHRRGSFTGATEHFSGIIRAAAGGTLFLDEIGDMGLDVQPKLLRFLESGEVHPIGEAQPVRADVRVIAATNADLDGLVAQGRFREDLFYRLNIVRLHLPPLRERRVEIPALANHYLQKHAQDCGTQDLRLAEETMEYLVLYKWPGNVRQLANEMRRMAALAETGAVLMPEHLSPEIAASRRTIPASERVLEPTEIVVRLDQPLAAAVEHIERAMLQYALKQNGGRMEESAAALGLSRKGLYLKRQRFGIDPPEPIGAAAVAAGADAVEEAINRS